MFVTIQQQRARESKGITKLKKALIETESSSGSNVIADPYDCAGKTLRIKSSKMD